MATLRSSPAIDAPRTCVCTDVELRRTHDAGKTQLGETSQERTEERPCRFLQRLQGVRRPALYRHEDRPPPQVALRSRRVERKEDHARSLADRIRRDEAPRRTRA